MRIERISIRAVTVSIILILGFLPFAHTYYIKTQHEQAALDTVVMSLRRVIEVASSAVLKRIQQRTHDYANNLIHNEEFKAALAAFQGQGETEAMLKVLSDPIEKGFVGAAKLDLVKLRFYDLDLQLRAQSRGGIGGLAQALPPFLYAQVASREGVERLKAVGGIWNQRGRPLYSWLMPVGGLHLTGYLEVLVEPAFNLQEMVELVQLPVKIFSPTHVELLSDGLEQAEREEKLAIHYDIRGVDDEVAFHVIAYEDVERLYQDMAKTQKKTIALFVMSSGMVLLIALWLFDRFLYRPFDTMLRDIRYISYGDLKRRVRENSLMEFHVLAEAFNAMADVVKNRTDALQELSVKDELTGVANRRCFDQVLAREWKNATRNRLGLSLLMLDIDYFKQYNDHYGHQQGDECLRLVAKAIDRLLRRPRDLFARYGGEEFAIILPETDQEGALKLARIVLDHIDELAIPHSGSKNACQLTLSIGVACLRADLDGADAAQLLKAADRALYQAKAQGRHQVICLTDAGRLVP